MTPQAREIAELQYRYGRAVRMRRHKAADLIFAKLRALRLKQLKTEARQEKDADICDKDIRRRHRGKVS